MTLSFSSRAPQRTATSEASTVLPIYQSLPRIIRFPGVFLIFPVAGVLAFVTAGQCHATLERFDPHVSFIPSLIFGAVMWVWWGLFAACLWIMSRRYPWIVAFNQKGLLFHSFISTILVLLHLALLQATIRWTIAFWPVALKAGYGALNYLNISRFGQELLLYACILGGAGIVSLKVRAHHDAIRAVELQNKLSEARLLALQMQIEPHFLFNTLNSIAALVDLRRNEEASATLEHLNSILRATLKRGSPERVTLAEEMEVVESYLAIQQIRFEDRLLVKTKVDPAALDGMVPLFLLQPIIENAVRHGIAHRVQDGVISTSVRRIGNSLHLEVKDNGPASFQAPSSPLSHGIGLKNTRERLAHFYPSTHEFVITQPAGGGFEVAITIPFERANR